MQKALADPPDLVLMDLAMPVMDGFTATQRLKADSRTLRVPVPAMSAQTFVPDSDQGAAAPAVPFIAKPCVPDVLLSHIRNALGRR